MNKRCPKCKGQFFGKEWNVDLHKWEKVCLICGWGEKPKELPRAKAR